ncbi:hypothetical protein HZ996_11070 [Cryomorphaceae bacterium]|nr:hypothetical protein HZ996_11070 [Cryomorphaceae bacterium]
MTFNKHYLGIVFRIVLLMLASWGAVYFYSVRGLYMTALLLLVVVIFQVLELFRLVRRTNRELTRLFESIRNNDFSLHFSEKNEGSGFQELHSSLNTIIDAYKRVKVQKEQHYQQLAQVVEYLNSGVLSYDELGHIHLMNSAARDILDIPALKDWSMISERRPRWTKAMEEIPFNEQRAVEIEGSVVNSPQLAFKGKIRLGDSEHTIISFQGIKDEVERQEIQAYHKLIRILTHEIMNSVTPISSLSETLDSMLRDEENGNRKRIQDLDDEQLEDLSQGLRTISKRSEGLLHFVDDYRKLTRIPRPEPEHNDLALWWKEIEPILQELCQRNGNQLNTQLITRNKTAFYDPHLLEQVLINLVKNANEALTGQQDGEIDIHLEAHGEQWSIQVDDNGSGIDIDKRSQIFIPFYSTKDQGSGIGLSLSKSILQSHRGKLIYTPLERGTRFTCQLPINPTL